MKKKNNAHNSFCKGIMCNKWTRKNQCYKCNAWVCDGFCSISYHNKIYCIDCYIDICLLRHEIPYDIVAMEEMKQGTKVKDANIVY